MLARGSRWRRALQPRRPIHQLRDRAIDECFFTEALIGCSLTIWIEGKSLGVEALGSVERGLPGPGLCIASCLSGLKTPDSVHKLKRESYLERCDAGSDFGCRCLG